MHAATVRPPVKSRVVRFLAVLLAVSLSACTTSLEPDDDVTDPPVDDPPPTVSYSVKIEYEKISVEADCDFAPPGNAGDFQYRVGYRIRPAGSSSEGSLSVVKETRRYNSESGDVVKIDSGKSHTLNAEASFTLNEGGGYFIQFDMREWDGNDRDLSMDHEHGTGSRSSTPSRDRVGTRDFSIQLGKNDQCRAKLEGSITERIVE